MIRLPIKMLLPFLLIGVFDHRVTGAEEYLVDYPEDINTGAVVRIVGGSVASPGRFPYQAYILSGDSSGKGAACGAVLIASEWLLTAAHCFPNNMVLRELVLGAQSILPTVLEPNRQTIRDFALVRSHPGYVDGGNYLNDIAIIKLRQPVVLNSSIKPIRLPRNFETLKSFARRSATVSGWGEMESGQASSELRYVERTVLTNRACRRAFNNLIPIPASQICTDGSNSKSSCFGDSGGPLAYRGRDGEWVLIGLVSYGNTKNCSDGSPTAYTRVTSYLPWIRSFTG